MNINNVLKTIENKNKGLEYTIELVSNELVSICPITHLPDFYTIKIIYKPDEVIIELRSLKLYFTKYLTKEITHESLLNDIYNDLWDILKPNYLKVELVPNIRGGINAKTWKEGYKNGRNRN